MFNWENIKVYDEPYKYAICDDFLSFYNDDLYPSNTWCEDNLIARENKVTKAISAINSIHKVNQAQKNFLSVLLSQRFHDQVCNLLDIPLAKETTGIRKTDADYRIAREAMFVQNLYSEGNILDIHYDSEVTIWTGLLYFCDSDSGTFNIHENDKSLHKKIPIKRNRLILTRNGNTSWHSVSPWLESFPRKSIYITSEFKNFGRDKDRKPIRAKELWC